LNLPELSLLSNDYRIAREDGAVQRLVEDRS
jgi:hypothetical protein